MNSKGHLIISTIKSAIRIIGCFVAAITKSVLILSLAFACAEICGILEELADKR